MKTPIRYRPLRRWLPGFLFMMPVFAEHSVAAQGINYLAAQLYVGNPGYDDHLPLGGGFIDEYTQRRAAPYLLPYRSPLGSSWAMAADNDVFIRNDRDSDYTYGFNFSYSGKAAEEGILSLDGPLKKMDRLLGLHSSTPANHTLEFGWFGFTPENIKSAAPNPDDRPYASLVYLSHSRQQVDYVEQVAWKTTLTLGALGLHLTGSFQNSIHEQLEVNPAAGWHHQISHGGELTGRYAVARQQHLGILGDNTELKSTLQASLGYLTEVSWSLGIRGGKYHTAWSSFNPELASYGEKSTYITSSSALSEHYFWAGFSLKARAYNSFLQGQFRDSAVTYSAADLKPFLAEAWLGYTFAFKEGYRISYALRAQSSEIKEGPGNRDILWGGLVISKAIH